MVQVLVVVMCIPVKEGNALLEVIEEVREGLRDREKEGMDSYLGVPDRDTVTS